RQTRLQARRSSSPWRAAGDGPDRDATQAPFWIRDCRSLDGIPMHSIENRKSQVENRQIAGSGWNSAMRNQSKFPSPKSKIPRGFTLIELLVVMVIIGIILVFIFRAAMESVERARERATQTLIAKLEGGLNDRLDALLQTRPDYNDAHLYMAGIYNS